MKFTVFGCSDDYVIARGDVRGQADGDEVEIQIGVTGRAAILTMAYVDPGIWQARIAQDEDSQPLPGTFLVRSPAKNETPYSVSVDVEVPDGTLVLWRTNPDEPWVVPS